MFRFSLTNSSAEEEATTVVVSEDERQSSNYHSLGSDYRNSHQTSHQISHPIPMHLEAMALYDLWSIFHWFASNSVPLLGPVATASSSPSRSMFRPVHPTLYWSQFINVFRIEPVIEQKKLSVHVSLVGPTVEPRSNRWRHKYIFYYFIYYKKLKN